MVVVVVNCDPATMFDCTGGAREKCISLESVCDGNDDCGELIDEAPHLCTNHSESEFVKDSAVHSSRCR